MSKYSPVRPQGGSAKAGKLAPINGKPSTVRWGFISPFLTDLYLIQLNLSFIYRRLCPEGLAENIMGCLSTVVATSEVTN